MNDLKSVQVNLDKYKIELPLPEKDEIYTIDNYFNEISDEFIQKYVHDKDLAAAQMVIRHLRDENKQLRKILDKIRSLLSDYEMQDNEVISIYCKEIRNCLKEAQ